MGADDLIVCTEKVEIKFETDLLKHTVKQILEKYNVFDSRMDPIEALDTAMCIIDRDTKFFSTLSRELYNSTGERRFIPPMKTKWDNDRRVSVTTISFDVHGKMMGSLPALITMLAGYNAYIMGFIRQFSLTPLTDDVQLYMGSYIEYS